MEVPRPDGPDVNRATGILIGCWTLTAVVFLVLTFRFAVKSWIAWAPLSHGRPHRVWGYEDIFFALGYGFDVAHTALLWKSYQHGLGRHFFYLTPAERIHAMRWDFLSQPLAVSAAMLSRSGVIAFLYSCFGQNRRSLRIVIILCFVVQIIANMVTILQIILQCGPHPYRLVDRTAYFHYMWDPLPADGSVRCQNPNVQATVGFVQGGFNTVIDLTLTYLAGFELWQFMFRASNHGRQTSFITKFKRLDSSVRTQRLWQTLLLCGPLLLSAIASIVKTYLLSALGSRLDFTWNIVPFILWVKIEDYCIPLAATSPILRLFIRTFMDQRGATQKGYGSSSNGPRSHHTGQALELSGPGRVHSTIQGGDDKGFDSRDTDEVSDAARSLHGSENNLVDHNTIMVKHEYEVRVEDGGRHGALPIMRN